MIKDKVFKGNYSIKEIFVSFKYWPQIFRLLWQTNKTSLLLLTFLNIVLGLIPTMNIYVTEYLFNELAVISNTLADVLIPLSLFCSILLFSNLLRIVQNLLDSLFGIQIVNKINTDIMEKAVKLRVEDFEDPEIQDQFKRALQETSGAPIQTFKLISQLATNVITFISLIVLIFVSLEWVTISLLILPIIHFIPNLKLTQYEYEVYWNRAPKQRIIWYLQYIISNYKSFKELKLNNSGNYFINEYSEIVTSFYGEDKKIQKRRLIMSFIVDITSTVLIVLILFYIVRLTLSQTILIGTSIALIQAVITSTNKLTDISLTAINFCQNNIYLDQFFRFLNFSSNYNEGLEEMNNKKHSSLQDIQSIEFRNVYFSYPKEEKYSLRGISFMISKGEIMAIVGQNGSGKSTIVKLISGLYDIDSGEILINGKPIHEFDREDIRRQISIMHQDYEQFEFSVRKNLSISNMNRLNQDDELYQSLESAGLKETFLKYNVNLDTQLGKWFRDGVQLSGGQWQRIAYARAMFKDANVNILDEPTSALDPYSEEEILMDFSRKAKDKIGLFISHRYSNIKYASKILVIHNGQVIEEGSHKELYDKKGYYYNLYNKQTGNQYSMS